MACQGNSNCDRHYTCLFSSASKAWEHDRLCLPNNLTVPNFMPLGFSSSVFGRVYHIYYEEVQVSSDLKFEVTMTDYTNRYG